ncbi:GNAT family N-acetyltransferase [Nocardioides salarius]|uniref:GNAT family N-acetyltransferase n=1 Tax=Nocardioides salarius TaxID=374513 RepID=UPI0030F597D0
MLTTRHGVRVLGAADLADFLALSDRDPVVNVFVDHRARSTNLEPRWLGGEVWGRYADGRLVAACHVGANLVPVNATPDDARAFAERALSRSRSVSTIVGPHDAVRAFWQVVSGSWGPPRETRWRQPHLELTGPSAVAADPRVRRTTREDMDLLYPACVAMYTEEVGLSPEAGGGADLYRARVAQLVSRGWSFARFDDGRLVFKAEVACTSPRAAQIQGVWVAPDRRGEGLAVGGMAAVAEIVRREVAPTVSLYVNEWNTAARRAYRTVGFEETARFSTVMF